MDVTRVQWLLVSRPSEFQSACERARLAELNRRPVQAPVVDHDGGDEDRK